MEWIKMSYTVKPRQSNQVIKRFEIAREKLFTLLEKFGDYENEFITEASLSLTYPNPFHDILNLDNLYNSNDGSLEFGISEFSLSISSSKSAELRCLAEVINSKNSNQNTISQIHDISQNLFQFLSKETSESYNFSLFSDIYHIIYPLSHQFVHDRQKIQMGLALGFKQDTPINIKAYFDLLFEGEDSSKAKVKKIFNYLSLQGYEKLVELANKMWYNPVYRGVGIDFSPNKGRNIRIYFPGKNINQTKLEKLLVESNLAENIDYLILFNDILLKGVKEFQNWPTFISIIFSEHIPNKPIIKFDLFLPPWYHDDYECSDAIHQLLSELKLNSSMHHYDQMTQIISENRNLDLYSNLHQFISIDFIPDELPKINIYLRPLGLETPSMDHLFYPRLNPKTLLKKQIETMIEQSILFLESQRDTNYAELTHHMTFPKKFGFKGPKEQHEGFVFQIAVVCDALINACKSGFAIDNDGLTNDIHKLVDAKCEDIPGGWKYFPSLYELPPDADDLGQILQVLVLSSCDHVSELCDPAIKLLLEHCSNQDGSLETWIIDKNDDSPYNIAMLNAINNSWGKSHDVEVMANILYALFLYNFTNFQNTIERGVEFIIDMQDSEGFWESTWYCGQFYATYVCTRLIAAINPNHNALKKVADFMVNSKKNQNRYESSLDIALKLLTISELINCGIKIEQSLIKDTSKILLNKQLTGGCWEASPFIQMDTNRALSWIGLAQPNIITYGSSTLSTAFCLKALVNVYKVIY